MIEIKCKVENFKLVPVDQIKPNPRNNNRHSIEQFEILKRIIKAHGFREPLTISNQSGFLNCGHLRLEVAKDLNMKEVPVIYQDFASEAEEYQHMTADNEVQRLSELDFQGVYDALKEIPDIDTSLLGIEDFKLPEIVEPQAEEDDVPEARPEPKVVHGEVYILGNHRLMCGDSTAITDVETLIKESKIDMVYTDPPYGINENGDRSKRNGKNSLRDGVIYENFKDDSIQYAIDAYNLCEALNIDIQIWWGANYYCHSLPQSNNWLIWDKRLEDKQRDFNSDCELAWVKNSKNSCRIFRHLWKGLIKGSENGQARVHPTQKPIALAEWSFDEYGNGSKNILDLFGGSGSTLIACEKKNLNCFMMELSPVYCGVILDRWQKFTGKKAHREDGKTWDEIKEAN